MDDGRDAQKERKWWQPEDIPMFVATVAAFLAVCVYCALTNQQVEESRKANDIASRSFITSNRPYVAWTNYGILRTINNDGAFKEWRIAPIFKNFGKTPATSVIVTLCDPIIRQNINPPNLKCYVADAGQPSNTVGPEQGN